MKVFLDANILFSGAQPQSRMRAFLAVLFEHAECLTNAYAAEEARRNLRLKYPAGAGQLEMLVSQCELVTGIAADPGIALPSKDVPILSGAMAGKATHLLTGDERDFGRFWGQTVQGVTIVSPRMLAEELVKRGWL